MIDHKHCYTNTPHVFIGIFSFQGYDDLGFNNKFLQGLEKGFFTTKYVRKAVKLNRLPFGCNLGRLP
jgi:hypothetical protein